jgi:uncharacterized repeat protein (TIGR03803 family)
MDFGATHRILKSSSDEPSALKKRCKSYCGEFAMWKLAWWKCACTMFLLCAAVATDSPAQTFKILVKFDGSSGIGPNAPLVQGTDGMFYGTASAGGKISCSPPSGCGTAFKMTPNGSLTRLHVFCARTSCRDGASPSSLILATDGNFYSTASFGGANGYGTVFKMTSGGVVGALHSFCGNCRDGSLPFVGLVQASNNNFYGMTNFGGSSNDGTIFQISPKGMLTIRHSFDEADGNGGGTPLIEASDGNLYGVSGGGTNNAGTLFRVSAKGLFTVLYSFCALSGCADGSFPSGLLEASDGNFYGITAGGGANCISSGGCGTFFKMSHTGRLTTLYSFCNQANCTDGNGPLGLIQATDGNFYGTTAAGGGSSNCNNIGSPGCGTVYKINSGGVLATLHSFDSADGAEPGVLVQATNGAFYGTTFFGGVNQDGVAFRLSVGLGAFVAFVRDSGKVGAKAEILGQGFEGTKAVSFNGTPASFQVVSGTYLMATVPIGATTGFVTVTTPKRELKSNKKFRIVP